MSLISSSMAPAIMLQLWVSTSCCGGVPCGWVSAIPIFTPGFFLKIAIYVFFLINHWDPCCLVCSIWNMSKISRHRTSKSQIKTNANTLVPVAKALGTTKTQCTHPSLHTGVGDQRGERWLWIIWKLSKHSTDCISFALWEGAGYSFSIGVIFMDGLKRAVKPLDQWFSTVPIWPPQETLHNVWGHFLVTTWYMLFVSGDCI